MTREENYDLLRQNSCVIWLQRDIAKLPTCGRPLSTGADLNEKMCIRDSDQLLRQIKIEIRLFHAIYAPEK